MRETHLPGQSHPCITCWAEAAHGGFKYSGSLGGLLSAVDRHTCAEQNGEGPRQSENMNIHLLIGRTSSPHAPNPATELPAEGLCAVIAGEPQLLVQIIPDKRLCLEFPLHPV